MFHCAMTLSARLAPPEAFRQANIDYASPLLGLKFSVEKISPDGQQLVLRQQVAIELRPLEQVGLLVVVGDERDALARGHDGDGSIHGVHSWRW